MEKLTDSELVEELKRRLRESNDTLDAMRSLTEKLKDVNRKLKESEMLKSNFLSNIRNEINNPLAAIMGFSRRLLSDSEASAIAGSIYLEAFNLDCQLKNIFAAAELEAGETALSVSVVDMDRLVRNTIDSFSHRAVEKKLSVDFSYDGPVCSGGSVGSGGEFTFRTDPEKIHLALSNLLSNAIEYSREEGRIELRAWRHEGSLNVSVRDFGIGMDEAEQKVIFDRFRRLDSGIEQSFMGHGLGLSVTKAVVEVLGGTISVSSAKGQGSSFTLTIPEAEAGTDIFSGENNEYIFDRQEEF